MIAVTGDTISSARKKDQDWFNKNNKTISRLMNVKHRTSLAFENHQRNGTKELEKLRISGGWEKQRRCKTIRTNETCAAFKPQPKRSSVPQGHQWVTWRESSINGSPFSRASLTTTHALLTISYKAAHNISACPWVQESIRADEAGQSLSTG